MKWSTPTSELIRWALRFQREWNEPDRRDWYLAQVAYEVARLEHTLSHFFSKERPPFNQKVADYLLDFVDPLKAKPEKTQEEKEREVKRISARSQSRLRSKFKNSDPNSLPAKMAAKKRGGK